MPRVDPEEVNPAYVRAVCGAVLDIHASLTTVLNVPPSQRVSLAHNIAWHLADDFPLGAHVVEANALSGFSVPESPTHQVMLCNLESPDSGAEGDGNRLSARALVVVPSGEQSQKLKKLIERLVNVPHLSVVLIGESLLSLPSEHRAALPHDPPNLQAS